MTGPSEPHRTPLDCVRSSTVDAYATAARRNPLCTHPGCIHKSAELCTHSASECVHTAEDHVRVFGRVTHLSLAVTLALAAALCLAALSLAALSLAACGSSGSSKADASAAAVNTTITAGVPKDESSEPPWNGRFVQVNVTSAKPGAMSPGDWHVTVNGKEPELDKPASILPYSPHGAMVAFVFRAPYTDLGTYRFRVTYTPKDGPKVERSWDYKW
jgi:hypothetical protein